MEYPKYDEYALLYARYLTPARTEQMLDLCGLLEGKHLLDLCGGGGRASRAAVARGAAGVVLVDESYPMAGGVHEPNVTVWVGSLKKTLKALLVPGGFDVAFCQQAINYWFGSALIKQVHKQLKPGGIFVFNTFNEAPPSFPAPKSYEYDGRKYMELSWLSAPNTVEHVQICDGEQVHTTQFQWISPKRYRQVLSPYFEVEEIRAGKTSIYRCIAL